MFLAISVLPVAASETLRLISAVVAACSSTALAMIPEISFILLMMAVISSIEVKAPFASACMTLMLPPISSVALAVWRANSLTSLATTAKPLPNSPARAASMVALSASKFVCSAMLEITFKTLPISMVLLPNLDIVSLVLLATSTA